MSSAWSIDTNREALLRHLETSREHVINSSTCVTFHARSSDVTPQTNDVMLILLLGIRIASYLSILTKPAKKLKAIDVRG